MSAPSFDHIDQYLKDGVAEGFNGAVFIAQDGEVVFERGYGLANKATGAPINDKTVFDIGSNTKQFTGAAILTLVANGQLALSDSLDQFFDAVPDDKKAITIHQLLTHTSGLQESLDSDFTKTTTEQFFADLFASPLYRPPGSTFNYSNLGYSVLARIIELVSDKDYETYLRDTLFLPSGMLQTGYLLPDWDQERLAIGYNRNIDEAGSTVRRYQEDKVVSWHLKGNGGINSTQRDMYQWIRAVSSLKILSASALQAWTDTHAAELDDGRHFYGYGWGIRQSDDGRIVYHNGSNGPFAHTILWNPEQDTVLIYATNANSPVVENLAYTIEKMWTDEQFSPDPIAKNPYYFVIDFIEKNPPSMGQRLQEEILTRYPEEFSRAGALNRLGYIVLRNNDQTAWAITLFKLNTELFPKDGNTWDSLGEAYVMDGQDDMAIAAFKQAVTLGYEDAAPKMNELITNQEPDIEGVVD